MQQTKQFGVTLRCSAVKRRGLIEAWPPKLPKIRRRQCSAVKRRGLIEAHCAGVMSSIRRPCVPR